MDHLEDGGTGLKSEAFGGVSKSVPVLELVSVLLIVFVGDSNIPDPNGSGAKTDIPSEREQKPPSYLVSECF